RALVNLEIGAENPVGTISFLSIQDNVGVLQFNALEILRLLEAGGANLENRSSAIRLRVGEALCHLRRILRQVVRKCRRLTPRPQNPPKEEPRSHKNRQHGSGSKELSHQLEIEGHRPLSILLFCRCAPHRQCGIACQNPTRNSKFSSYVILSGARTKLGSRENRWRGVEVEAHRGRLSPLPRS